jgi:hypothetical protein
MIHFVEREFIVDRGICNSLYYYAIGIHGVSLGRKSAIRQSSLSKQAKQIQLCSFIMSKMMKQHSGNNVSPSKLLEKVSLKIRYQGDTKSRGPDIFKESGLH